MNNSAQKNKMVMIIFSVLVLFIFIYIIYNTIWTKNYTNNGRGEK